MATPKTTVKVQTSTRDLLNVLGAERRETADQVIRAALTALQRDQRKQVTAAEARAIVAFTSTSAWPTSFRPQVEIGDRRTLVLCDQLATDALTRRTEPPGHLTLDEMRRVDEALTLILDL